MGRQMVLVPDRPSQHRRHQRSQASLCLQEKIDVLDGPDRQLGHVAGNSADAEWKTEDHQHHRERLGGLLRKLVPYHFSMLASAPDSGRGLVDYLAEGRRRKTAAPRSARLTATSKNGMDAIKESLKEKNRPICWASRSTNSTDRRDPAASAARRLNLGLSRSSTPPLRTTLAWCRRTSPRDRLEREVGRQPCRQRPAPELVISKAGPDAYKNMLGQVIGRFTYCPKEGEAAGRQDRDRLRHARALTSKRRRGASGPVDHRLLQHRQRL